jgi:glycosyltransferase involved in cell wall biosynthesis
MVPLFRESAIVCLPSYREGMPKALLEAAAAGCAVVTTDVTGCREAIEPGVTGDLVPVRNSEALAAVLLSLIKDEKRCQAYGAKGQERARTLFSVTSVVSQTVKIYKELLGHA